VQGALATEGPRRWRWMRVKVWWHLQRSWSRWVFVAEELACRCDEVHLIAAQVRVAEAEKVNSQTALDSTRDQLASVTEQYSQARQHVSEIEVGRCWRCISLSARHVKISHNAASFVTRKCTFQGSSLGVACITYINNHRNESQKRYRGGRMVAVFRGADYRVWKLTQQETTSSSSWWRAPSRALPYWRPDAFLHAVWTPKFCDCKSSPIILSQVVLGRPAGLLQSDGGRSAVAMTRWWSSSGFNRARCPKNLNHPGTIYRVSVSA